MEKISTTASSGSLKYSNTEILKMGEIAQKTLEKSKIETNKTLNKNRLNSSRGLEKGDIVYALDQTNLTGNSRTLKTTLSSSSYIHVLIEAFFTTSLIERLVYT
jgi:hypothetical protein